MKIRKIIASILAATILIVPLSLTTFASSVVQTNVSSKVYPGKNIDLNNWFEVSSKPTFNGVPYRVPGDEAFYSTKGEIKLKIDDNNRSYFENGGALYLYVNKSPDKLHLNPFNWMSLLSYKPESGTNSFKINGPKSSILEPLNRVISFFTPQSSPWIFLLATSATWWEFGFCKAALFFVLVPLLPVGKNILDAIIAPLNNLSNNANENKLDFDYGIILTDSKDELVLNRNLPKPGDVNEKKLKDYLKSKNEREATLRKYNINTDFSSFRTPGAPNSNECLYNKNEIEEMKKEADNHRAETYQKLVTETPKNDGLIFKLDKDHPSQTFRLVINNQFPDSPNNADLFALALQNNFVSLTQSDSQINFIATYNALDPEKSTIANRLSDVSEGVQQKINRIQNLNTPGFFSKAFSWLKGLISNNFSLTLSDPKLPTDSQSTQTTPPTQTQGQQGAQITPPTQTQEQQIELPENINVDPLALLKSKNNELLQKAVAAYNDNPTRDNANALAAAKQAYIGNQVLNSQTATGITNRFNNLPEDQQNTVLQQIATQDKLLSLNQVQQQVKQQQIQKQIDQLNQALNPPASQVPILRRGGNYNPINWGKYMPWNLKWL